MLSDNGKHRDPEDGDRKDAPVTNAIPVEEREAFLQDVLDSAVPELRIARFRALHHDKPTKDEADQLAIQAVHLVAEARRPGAANVRHEEDAARSEYPKPPPPRAPEDPPRGGAGGRGFSAGFSASPAAAFGANIAPRGQR